MFLNTHSQQQSNADVTNHLVANLAIVFLMLLDASNLPLVRSGDLRMEITNRVFSKQITDQGLFEFLHHLSGLPAKRARSVSEIMAEANVRQVFGIFMEENMQEPEWTVVGPTTIQDVVSEHISPLRMDEILSAMQNVSRWPGMDRYFFHLWNQSGRRTTESASQLPRDRSGVYHKRRFWRLPYGWPFRRGKH